MEKESLLRNLPKIDILADTVMKEAADGVSISHVTESCRKVIDSIRALILKGELTALPRLDEIVRLVFLSIEADNALSLRPVINATGVVIHTNLGRAILSESVAENIKRIASSYSTLEYSLKSGERGSRHSHIENIICRLTGAEAAMAVNNNAAAIMLALSAMCKGREVVVSRGELVEIGGSFRVPEIMSLSGTVLREVGTTNKTKLADYENAITEQTAALLKVHTSNFKVVGFTESVDIAALSSVARQNHIPLIFDLGSGLLMGDSLLNRIGETNVVDSLAAGADIVCFSGDKLFGGAQAGIIVGRKRYIDEMKAHQLARVVRIDKLSLAALEATLKLYLDKKNAIKEIPVLASLSMPLAELEARAKKLKRRLNSANASVAIKLSEGQVGGGSAPGESLESVVIEITSNKKTAQTIEREFREFETPIITRINKGAVLIDVRTLKESEFDTIAAAFKGIFERTENE